MADTIITNSPDKTDSGAAGWAVAVIILLAVVVGGFVWYRYYGAYRTPAAPGSTNINVTIPDSTTQSSGGTAPAAGGGVQY